MVRLTLARLRLCGLRLRGGTSGTRCSGSRFCFGGKGQRRVHVGHERGKACKAFAFSLLLFFFSARHYHLPLNESDAPFGFTTLALTRR